MKKNIICLIAGVVMTLLFLLFSGAVLDSVFSGQMEFANEMYNANLYTLTTLFAILIAWGLAGIYYYVINSVSFSRWYHWLVVLVLGVVASPVVAYVYCDSVFADNGVDFSSELYGFALINLVVEAAAFIIASFSMRWWSSNCRHTPIPE